ncbi:unnamed protein product [Rhizophagus irregularis]|uniref:Uncharacterized protein n=1 Tax=Rhizophagus irregularis TaxID=588596 RepID=A0A915ZY56_9GLOM|nr:unnamed protein product [Rhizophagus irregularis]
MNDLIKFLNQNITDFKVEDISDLMFLEITAYKTQLEFYVQLKDIVIIEEEDNDKDDEDGNDHEYDNNNNNDDDFENQMSTTIQEYSKYF